MLLYRKLVAIVLIWRTKVTVLVYSDTAGLHTHVRIQSTSKSLLDRELEVYCLPAEYQWSKQRVWLGLAPHSLSFIKDNFSFSRCNSPCLLSRNERCPLFRCFNVCLMWIWPQHKVSYVVEVCYSKCPINSVHENKCINRTVFPMPNTVFPIVTCTLIQMKSM